MEPIAKAKLSYVRISPRKVKIVIDLIRNKPVGTALAILRNTPKAASPIVEKLLLSAMANAENNHNMDVSNLYVAEVFAGAGPILKRIRPRAQGRAYRIYKRTSHITIVLKEYETAAPKAEPAKKGGKKKAEEAPAEEKAAKKTTAAKKPAAKKAAAAKDGDAQPKPRKPRASKKKAETEAEKPAETASADEA